MKLLDYETPQLEIVEVEIEEGFGASNGNLENPEEGETSEW